MYRVITVEREFGCGGGEIAALLSKKLGWELWDHKLTEEIAALAHVDCSTVERRQERVDSSFYRLAKTFWRGSNERSMHMANNQPFDADCMVEMGRRVMEDAASQGNCVIVGRGAPYFLKEHCDTFHVFMYASRSEKLRRLVAGGRSFKEAEELIDSVDRDRITFVKHYFGADWPTRCLYHMMINTSIGNEGVIASVLETMRILERTPVHA